MAKAVNDAAEAKLGVAAINVRLDNFITDNGRQWSDLRRDMQVSATKSELDQKEWRMDLGKRLDKQDAATDAQSGLQWKLAGATILLLLAILGFFVSHLPLFSHFVAEGVRYGSSL